MYAALYVNVLLLAEEILYVYERLPLVKFPVVVAVDDEDEDEESSEEVELPEEEEEEDEEELPVVENVVTPEVVVSVASSPEDVTVIIYVYPEPLPSHV